MNPGVTIFLRAGDDLAASLACLESLAEHNRYKPLEVLLWANAAQDAIALVRSLLPRLFVRVLPTKADGFARVAGQARYDNILFMDSSARIRSDVLAGWLKHQKTDMAATLLCQKSQLVALANQPVTLPLDQVANCLGQPVPQAPRHPKKQSAQFQVQPAAKPITAAQKSIQSDANRKAQTKKIQYSDLDQHIAVLEKDLQRMDDELITKYNEIEHMSAHYDTLSEASNEAQKLKKKIKEYACEANAILHALKRKYDDLECLRIYRYSA